MGNGQPQSVLRYLRRLVDRPNAGPDTDRQLLNRYSAGHEEDSFETIVRRHGPMVMGVCRRVLGNAADADDAFQATFLVLVQKAGAVRWHDSVGNWLYGVAYRVARKARARAHRPVPVPTSVAEPPGPDADAARRELRELLEAELQQLPDKYRAPVVLHYLEGRTKEETARHLGWTEGTVSGRLARARDLLRRRLSRRGVSVPAGLVAALLAENATAAVPAGLREATLGLAGLVQTGLAAGGAVPGSVAVLAEGALGAMGAARRSLVRALVLLACTIGVGTAALARQASQTKPPEPVSELPSGRPATDRYGDPLPAGAVARLGTTRLRHTEGIACLAFSPRSNVLATGGGDGAIRLWKAPDFAEQRQLHHEGRLASLAFSPDGRTLAAAGGGHVTLWDPATGRELRRLPCPTTFAVQGGTSWLGSVPLAFSADGELVASPDKDFAVHVWETATGKERLLIRGHDQEVGCLDFPPGGKTLLSAAGKRQADGAIIEWDLNTGQETRRFALPAQPFRSSKPYAFSPDGKTLAVEALAEARETKGGTTSMWVESRVHLWDVATGKERLQLKGQPDPIYSASFSPDGKTLATVGMDHAVKVWDTTNGRKLFQFLAPPGGGLADQFAVAFAPDGRTLASSVSGSSVQLWDVRTGRPIHLQPDTHGSALSAVTFSPDGRTVATGSADHTIRLWEAGTGEPRGVLRGHEGDISSLAFSPDGRLLATAAQDRTVRLWDPAAGTERQRWTLPDIDNGDGSTLVVRRTLAFTADGKFLVAFGSDRKFRRWSMPDGKEEVTHQVGPVVNPRGASRKSGDPTEYLEHISHVRLSPDGRLAALASAKTIYVVDTATGAERFQVPAADSQLSLVFSPDGQTLATGGWDKKIRLWETATGQVVWTTSGLDFINAVAFAPNGRSVAAAAGWKDAAIYLLDAADGKQRLTLRGHQAYVGALAFSPDGRTLASAQRDATALLWDVTPAAGLTHHELGDKEFAALWADLASEDAAKAHRAWWKLAAAGDQAVARIGPRLPPAPKVKPDRLAQLVEDLDSDSFTARDEATRELRRLGVEAEPDLRRALQGKLSSEARRRVEELLSGPRAWSPLPPDQLRRLRAVRALTQVGSEEARRVLASVASGAPGAVETQAAHAALAQ